MKKIFNYIKSHLLLRNIILALCLGLVTIFLINLSLSLFTRHGQRYIVPDFTGKTYDEAKLIAKKGRMELLVIDSLYVPHSIPGMILDQNPKPESGVKSGRKILLTINSIHPRSEIIPYVTGYSLRQAKNQLENKGFEIAELIYRSDMATNNVLSQRWDGREIVRGSNIQAVLGSGVTLVVGRNPQSAMPIVPKVIELTLREAKSRLWELGFNIGEITYDSEISQEDYEKARIYRQMPYQESRNDYGSKVSLWLTIDNKRVHSSSRAADETSRREIELAGDSLDGVSDEEMLRELGLEE